MRGLIGQNLSYLKPFAGRVLIDAAKQGEAFAPIGGVTGGASEGVPLAQFDPVTGWPLVDCRWPIIQRGNAAFNGDYQFSYTGKLALLKPVNSPVTLFRHDRTDSGGSGVIRLAATGTQTAQLTLDFAGPAGFRDFKLIRPGYTFEQAKDQVWTTEYLDLLRKLNAGTLRFMDAQRINGNDTTDRWLEPEFALWSVKGIGCPLQPLFDLAERINADPWVNIPAKATDAWVRRCAQEATIGLTCRGTPRRCIVEYGNELWNTAAGFSQSQYVKEQGAAVGLTARQWAAKRASEVAAIFLDEFTKAGMADLLVPVLCGATNDSGVLGDMLLYLKGKPNPFKALAVAGYFGAARDAKTPDDVFWGLATSASLLHAGKQMAKFNAQVASGAYEKMIYEWSPSIETGVPGLPALVNTDPRIAAPIKAWAAGWDGGPAVHFCAIADFGGAGWAATDAVEKFTPKCAALAEISAAKPILQPVDVLKKENADLKGQLATLGEYVKDLEKENGTLTDRIIAAERDAKDAHASLDACAVALDVARKDSDAAHANLAATVLAAQKVQQSLNAANDVLLKIQVAGGWK